MVPLHLQASGHELGAHLHLVHFVVEAPAFPQMQEKNSTMLRTVIGLVIVVTVALGCYYVFAERPAASQPYMPIPDKEDETTDETDVEMPPVVISSSTSVIEGRASSERDTRSGSSSGARKQTSDQTADSSDKRIPFPDLYNTAEDKQPLTKKVGNAVPTVVDKRSLSPKVSQVNTTRAAQTVNHEVKPEPIKLVVEAKVDDAPTAAQTLPQAGDDESEDINTVDVTKMPAVYEIGTYGAPALHVDYPATVMHIHAPRGTFAGGNTRVGTVFTSDEHAWETSAELWGVSQRALEDALQHSLGVLKELDVVTITKPLPDEQTLLARLGALKKEIASASTAEAAAQVRLTTLLAKFGTGHVQRDDPSTASASFPSGGDIVEEARRVLANFDDFVCHALRSLRDSAANMSESDTLNVFVHSIMRPLFDATLKYMQDAISAKQARMQQLFGEAGAITSQDSDCVAWQFSLHALQPLVLSQISALSDQDVKDIVLVADSSVWKLQGALETVAGPGLDVTRLVRVLLRLHAMALLSDPRCYLYPAPGERMRYRQDHCAEIPCAKTFGAIKEGEMVEVVFSGLYFQDPAAGTLPEVLAFVQRLL